MTGLFEHPEWCLPVAGGLALAIVARTIGVRRARARGVRLLGPSRSERASVPGRDIGLLVALLLVGVALVGPRIGDVADDAEAGGADVVLLLDLSRSMDAADTPPSRLRRALATARALLAGLAPGDRVALAGFAGRAVLFTPLTPDRDAVADMLAHLDSGLIRPGGSELAAGVAAAVDAFAPPGDRPRVLVVWSDGELSDPAGAVGAEVARRAGARVVAIGMGSESGATVPDVRTPLRDDEGRVVVSRRFLAPLEALATATDGTALAADEWGGVEVERLVALVDGGAHPVPDAAPGGSEPDAPARRPTRVAVAWPFAAAAAIALLAESLASRRGRGTGRPRRRRDTDPPPGRSRRVAVGAAIATGLALLAASRGPDPDPDAAAMGHLERAIAHAETGAMDEAARALGAASVLARDPDLVAIAEYDLGVLALARGDLEAARDRFLTALVYAPRDERARFNAEWTLRALAARRPAASADPATAADARRRPEETAPAKTSDADDGEAPAPAAQRDAGAGPGEGGAGQAPSAGRSPARADASATGPRALDESERARWLARVVDDSARALRLAARERRSPATPRRRMTW